MEEVTSLVNARNTRGVGDSLVVEGLMEDWPETADDLRRLRARVLDTPMYLGLLVNSDLTATTVQIEPFVYSTLGGGEELVLDGFEDDATGANEDAPEFLTEGEHAELIAELRAIVEQFRAADFDIYISSGTEMSQSATTLTVRDTAFFLSAGSGVMALLLFVLFRRLSSPDLSGEKPIQ